MLSRFHRFLRATLMLASLVFPTLHVLHGAPIDSLGGTHNQQQVVNQLLTISTPTPIESQILLGLTTLPRDQARRSLDQMSGEQYTSTLLAAEFGNRQFLRRLYDPLRLIIDPHHNDTTVVVLFNPQECPCGADTGELVELQLDSWVEGSGHQVFLKAGGNVSAVRISGYEFSVGGQMTFNRHFTLGAAFSYEMDHLHYDIGGSGKSSITLGGVYGLYRPDDFYVLGDFIFGYSHNRLNRQISIGTLSFTTHGKPDVVQAGYYVEIGTDILWSCMTLQPFLGLEGGYYRFNNIVESGGDPLNLTVGKKSVNPAYTRLGIHLETHSLPCDWIFGIDLAWQYRLTSVGTNVDAEFQDFGSLYEIKGQHLQRNSFEMAVNIANRIDENWEIFGEASGQSWINAISYTLMLGIGASW